MHVFIVIWLNTTLKQHLVYQASTRKIDLISYFSNKNERGNKIGGTPVKKQLYNVSML